MAKAVLQKWELERDEFDRQIREIALKKDAAKEDAVNEMVKLGPFYYICIGHKGDRSTYSFSDRAKALAIANEVHVKLGPYYPAITVREVPKDDVLWNLADLDDYDAGMIFAIEDEGRKVKKRKTEEDVGQAIGRGVAVQIASPGQIIVNDFTKKGTPSVAKQVGNGGTIINKF